LKPTARASTLARGWRHTGRMSNIDKQRIAAVRTLVDMGYVFLDEWIAPMCVTTPATAEADAMHALLVQRADQLDGCTEGSSEAAELEQISNGPRGLRGQVFRRLPGFRSSRSW